MENTKKMMLVDASVIEKLKQKESAPQDTLTRLDEEMQNIMNRKLNDREKWALYSQTLQRYFHFAEGERQPIKLPIITENNNVVGFDKTVDDETVTKKDVTPYTPSVLFKLVPKTYIKRGELLLENLLKSEDKITWDERSGVVTIKNEKIPNSNIVDLFQDTLRPLKRPKPIGWQEFAKTLWEIGVPNACIGNPKTFEYINMLNLGEREKKDSAEFRRKFLDSPPFSTPKDKPSSSTPRTHQHFSTKRKFDWEKWTPY